VRSVTQTIFSLACLQVKIWFQNRRTKWKKQDNVTNSEAAEYKTTTNVNKSSPTAVDLKGVRTSSTPSPQASPIPQHHHPLTAAHKPILNPVSAELNAKLTAKHSGVGKSRSTTTSSALQNLHKSSNKMIRDLTMKSHTKLKPGGHPFTSPPSNDVLDMKVEKHKVNINNNNNNNNNHSYLMHPDNDVETRLSASKISVGGAFKSTSPGGSPFLLFAKK
jgi:Homeodomain